MLRKFLLDILADPITNEGFVLDESKKSLITAGGYHYEIKEGVPVLLRKDIAEKQSTNSQLHTDRNTNFDYIAHYNKDAGFFNYFDKENPVTAAERKRSRQYILSEIPDNTRLILDIGSGSAWVAANFAQKDKYVVSLDIAEKNSIEAQHRYNSDRHAAVVADALHLPFKSDSFDVVIASEVIEHVYEPVIFVEEWLRVIKPGGRLIIVTPYNEKRIFHICVHCNEPTPANAHLSSFNEQNIGKLFQNVSAEISTRKFSNRWFTQARIYYFLRSLSFRVWKRLDMIVNSLIKKPDVFLILADKK